MDVFVTNSLFIEAVVPVVPIVHVICISFNSCWSKRIQWKTQRKFPTTLYAKINLTLRVVNKANKNLKSTSMVFFCFKSKSTSFKSAFQIQNLGYTFQIHFEKRLALLIHQSVNSMILCGNSFLRTYKRRSNQILYKLRKYQEKKYQVQVSKYQEKKWRKEWNSKMAGFTALFRSFSLAF